MRKILLVPLMAVMVTLLSGCWWGPHGHHHHGGGYDRGGYDRGGYDRGGHDRHHGGGRGWR
jgi:hypothetical protein